MFNRSQASASGGRKVLAALLAGAILSTTALTASRAQNAEPVQTPPAASENAAPSRAANDGERRSERMERRAERRGGHHQEKHGRHHRRGGMAAMMTPARVAMALAAFETGIGVTPEQMDVWREFSSAAVAFAAASQPGFGRRSGADRDMTDGSDEDANAMEMDGETANAPDETSDGTAGNQSERAGRTPFAFIDRITERSIAAGEAATRLQTATADLEEVLTPEQVDTARTLMRSMMREARMERGGRHGMRGHREHHGRHHGRY
ncbi:hypothetical protein [Fulvimarina pelagi]|nr:hypothetical protein [Fulvimarina pelagi]BAT31406.1 hypothetical protein [Fulvimarina pelagi]